MSRASGSNITFHQDEGNLVVSYTQPKGISIVELDGGKARVLLLDRSAAYRFWAPSSSIDPFAPEDETGMLLLYILPGLF